ncbi:MAG: aromatic ring-hydroxylating dioxygenase subunit alpha [Pseudomonadota bacterium]
MLTQTQVRQLYRETGEAQGLPGFVYTSEDFARAEHEKLFARTWMCAGYAHEIAQPGDVLPRTVAGVPILFTHDRDGQIGCFHNICTHRGSLLVPEAKSGAQTLQCRYHAWTFDLAGNLRATPHWGGHNQPKANGFDRSCHGLKPVRMARWHDWLFVNLDGNAPPFEDYAAPFQKHFDEYDLDQAVWTTCLPFDINGNWKLVAENYLEVLHLPYVHTVLAEAAPFQEHDIITDGACLGTVIDTGLPASWSEDNLPRWPGIAANAQNAKNMALFPNFKLVIGPDHCCSMVEFPAGASKSHQRWDFYFVGEGGRDARYEAARDAIIEFYRKTNVEDFEAVEGVHAGHMSPAMTGAQFSGVWEGAVHHFQKLVADAMVDDNT